MTNSLPLIIHHGSCPDGFTAAWAATKALGECELYSALHGDLPPDVPGRDVYIVDFSYPRAKLHRMRRQANSLLVLDHHKTAEAEFADLDYCVFDMDRSGAGLTWDTLNPEKPRPWLIDYVEDRDLWRFALPWSKEVSAYVMSQPYTLAAWDILAALKVQDVQALGGAIQLKVETYCAAMAKQAARIPFGRGYSVVPIVNAPYIMISDLLNLLIEEQGPMAIGWFQRGDGKYHYSLRSDGSIDVSEIAKSYGGGGHLKAAGFVADARPAEFCY